MLRRTFAALLSALVDACRHTYGDRLEGLVAFGSVARGVATPESDIDVLLIAEPLPRGRFARMDEFRAVEQTLEPDLARAARRGVHTRLSPLLVTPSELRQLGFLLFDIACDGVVLYDRSGRVAAALAQVRRELEERGVERRSLHGSPYWVLPPPPSPGAPVELWPDTPLLEADR